MDSSDRQKGSYKRFFTMIGTSGIVMFLLMYLHSYEILGHARFSETRLMMTFIMVGAMMVIMLAFMLGMYKNRAVNTAIFVAGVSMLAASVWLVRSQVTVDSVDYMEGMIPHHSIAILTSERAGLDDHRVQKLANAIIQAQRREIREMNWLIEDIRRNGVARTEAEARKRPVPQLSAK